MQRRSEEECLHGHVVVRVDAADQCQRGPTEDSLDDSAHLIGDGVAQEQPVLAQALVLAHPREPAFAHRHRVLQDYHHQVGAGEPRASVSRTATQATLYRCTIAFAISSSGLAAVGVWDRRRG